jgi:hypothetical protein
MLPVKQRHGINSKRPLMHETETENEEKFIYLMQLSVSKHAIKYVALLRIEM